jgi:hypothetical protein
MKYGAELEEEIVVFLGHDASPEEPLMLGSIQSFFAWRPSESLAVEQALTRLVKKGQVVETRDENNLRCYYVAVPTAGLRRSLADASYVLDWLRARESPENIIGLQERVVRTLGGEGQAREIRGAVPS